MTWAVVPAAGAGRRFGGDVAKQYVELDGEPLLAHALRALLAHPQVLAARVSTEKPDVYPDCEAVGVEVFAFKDGVTAGALGPQAQ